MTAFYQLLNSSETNGIITTQYTSNIHAQGVWNDYEQHIGPVTGVICREMEHYAPRNDMRIGRVSIDILGVIPFGKVTISTKTIRSGRTIELIESIVTAKDKTYVIARAWRMQTSDSSTAHLLQDKPVKRFSELEEVDVMTKWGGGFMDTLITHPASDIKLGKGLVWVSTKTDMVDGHVTTDFVRLMGLVDTANGVAPCIDFEMTDPKNSQSKNSKWIFPNLDIQIHMHRLPQGCWLGLETVQQIGTDGIGLTSSILHDERGAFGRSEQILTVRNV